MIRNAHAAARFAAVASAAILVAAAGLLPAASHAQQPATSEATAAASTRDATAGAMIPQGTPVFVTLKQRLRSGTARRGETVTFAVMSDVRHGGAAAGPNTEVLIPAGTPAFGTVVESRGAGAFGKPGRLRLTCDYVLLPNGTRLSLRPAATGAAGATNSLTASGRSRRGAAVGTGLIVGIVTGVVVDFAVNFTLFGGDTNKDSGTPALAAIGSGLLVSSLWRGGNVTLPEGKTFAVEVAAPVAAPAPVAPAVGTDGRSTDQP